MASAFTFDSPSPRIMISVRWVVAILNSILKLDFMKNVSEIRAEQPSSSAPFCADEWYRFQEASKLRFRRLRSRNEPRQLE